MKKIIQMNLIKILFIILFKKLFSGYPPTRNVVGPMVGNVVNMEHTRTSNP